MGCESHFVDDNQLLELYSFSVGVLWLRYTVLVECRTAGAVADESKSLQLGSSIKYRFTTTSGLGSVRVSRAHRRRLHWSIRTSTLISGGMFHIGRQQICTDQSVSEHSSSVARARHRRKHQHVWKHQK